MVSNMDFLRLPSLPDGFEPLMDELVFDSSRSAAPVGPLIQPVISCRTTRLVVWLLTPPVQARCLVFRKRKALVSCAKGSVQLCCTASTIRVVVLLVPSSDR